MRLDKDLHLRVSTKEYQRWKRNCGNVGMTIRCCMDVHCTQIEKAREYEKLCFRMLEESEKELKKLGAPNGKVRSNKRINGRTGKSTGCR